MDELWDNLGNPLSWHPLWLICLRPVTSDISQKSPELARKTPMDDIFNDWGGVVHYHDKKCKVWAVIFMINHDNGNG